MSAIKVRFYELDPYDHVNHTNYLAYFETARIEMLGVAGWGMGVLADMGIRKVVVGLQAEFRAAARLGEELTIHTWIEDMGRARTHWRQVMTRDETEVARLSVSAAFTDFAGRPIRVPDGFEAGFSG